MKSGSHSNIKFVLSRAVIPLSIFVLVWIIHFTWLGLFPEQLVDQKRWVDVESVTTKLSWWQSYLEEQSYFLGFSYALTLAFSAVAFRKYREQRFCGSKIFVIGGISFSGILAFAGCFLIGCCGSPMLAIYLGLFGAKFLPFANSMVAGVTTLFVAGAWWWMHRNMVIQEASLIPEVKQQGKNLPEDCGCK